MKQPDNRLTISEYDDIWYCDVLEDDGFDYTSTIGVGRSRLTALTQALKRLKQLMHDIDKMIEKERVER